MTTTPHHDLAAGRYPADLQSAAAGLGAPYPGQGDPWTGLPGLQFPVIPDPRTPEYAQAQPYLTFPTTAPTAPTAATPPTAPTAPTPRAPQPSDVLATRIVGLIATILAALWPAFFALMALAFGLGLENAAGIVFGVVVGVLAIGWPLGFWFATSRARRVWPVLVALVPTMITVAWTVWVVIQN